ncbi:MAG: glycosyltransferase family 4 protein [Nitrospirota bacterium]|nr:glycosyltransferase family 4 protein [Nitrospirota bacterium]
MEIAFLDSWHRCRARGSGTAAAIDGLGAGLRDLGHRVIHLRAPERPPTLISRLRYNLELPSRLAGRRFDLLVGFDWDGFSVRPAPNQRYVVALKGVCRDEARFERGIARAALAVQGRLEACNARRAHRVLVPSLYSARAACRNYGLDPGRVAVVPEGVSLPEPFPASGDAPPEILTVARQYPRKNTATLLTALTRVRRVVPGVRLRVVGGGPELPRLREQARAMGLLESVTFTGEVPDAVVRDAYRRAAVFCLPSLQEGFGIAFLEAMASGLPVIAGNAGATPEVVANGATGLLVPPTDPHRLSEALIRLLTAPALRARMGRAARRHAATREWHRVARLFLLRAGAPAG